MQFLAFYDLIWHLGMQIKPQKNTVSIVLFTHLHLVHLCYLWLEVTKKLLSSIRVEVSEVYPTNPQFV